ncbi:MAG: activase, partial [Chitinivibrionales bacterium]|nr:activase [Chitinivibrionales bacterium]
MSQKSLGICLGASTIKLVELVTEGDKSTVGKKVIRNHESNPRRAFVDLLREVRVEDYDYVALTGRKFREIIKLKSITEPEAIEYALRFEKPGAADEAYNAVAGLGAENFVIYLLDSSGNIASVETGNKCASGTGEFFLQQLGRMDVDVARAVELAEGSD